MTPPMIKWQLRGEPGYPWRWRRRATTKPAYPWPKSQPLPRCWKHPDKDCPGECQYLLPAHKCAND